MSGQVADPLWGATRPLTGCRRSQRRAGALPAPSPSLPRGLGKALFLRSPLSPAAAVKLTNHTKVRCLPGSLFQDAPRWLPEKTTGTRSANELLSLPRSVQCSAAPLLRGSVGPARPPGEPIKNHDAEKRSRNAPLRLAGGLPDSGTRLRSPGSAQRCLSLQPGSPSPRPCTPPQSGSGPE